MSFAHVPMKPWFSLVHVTYCTASVSLTGKAEKQILDIIITVIINFYSTYIIITVIINFYSTYIIIVINFYSAYIIIIINFDSTYIIIIINFYGTYIK